MISSDVEYWIKCFDIFSIFDAAGDRPILIWGAYSKGCMLDDEIEKRGVKVAGYIDGHKDLEEYNGKKVYKPRDILPLRQHYVIVAIDGVRNEIKDHLGSNGYEKGKDYFYFSEHVPDIVISELMGEYCDIYGNRFIYEGDGRININIHCVAGGNTVIIGKNFDGDRKLNLEISYGGKIVIGDNFSSRGDVTFDATVGGSIIIGNSFNLMKDGFIKAKYGGLVKLGDYISCGKRLYMSSGRTSGISLGNDCMLSHDITILGTNDHSILDLEARENRTKKTEKPINIGNHVWLGKGSSILYGTTIGDGSIVGMQSMLKGNYPSECIISGNIASVTRHGCTWDRRREIEFEEF